MKIFGVQIYDCSKHCPDETRICRFVNKTKKTFSGNNVQAQCHRTVIVYRLVYFSAFV